MRLCDTILLWAWAMLQSVATPFHTHRLQQIATNAALQLPADMKADSNNDSTWAYRGRTLRVCTNRFGEVSHIGYRLFGNETLRTQESPYVLTFIERLFLELDLTENLEKKLHKLELDNVTLVKGDLSLTNLVDALTPFKIEYVTRRAYRATWTMDDGQTLCISFPADSQLLTGCNAIELENLMGRDLPRQKAASCDELVAPWNEGQETRDGKRGTKYRVLDLGNYLSPLIGSKLYLTRQAGGGWQLEQSTENKTRSVCNVMLTGGTGSDLPMQLVLDKYGYKADTLRVTLRQFLAYCRGERCRIYIGIKKVTPEATEGTLFVANDPLAYNHILSFSFPTALLEDTRDEKQDTRDKIRARLYAYIPLQNVTEKFFEQNLYKEIDYEN